MSDRLDARCFRPVIATYVDECYERSPTFRAPLGVWSDSIASYGGPSVRALDAGFGTSALTIVAERACASILGFDPSLAMLVTERRRAQARRVVCVEIGSARLPYLVFPGAWRLFLVIASLVGAACEARRGVTQCRTAK